MFAPIIRGGIAAVKAGKKALKKRKDKKLMEEYGGRNPKEARQIKELDKKTRKEVEKEMASPEYQKKRQRKMDAMTLKTYRKRKDFPKGAKNLKEAKEMDMEVRKALNERKGFGMKAGGKVKGESAEERRIRIRDQITDATAKKMRKMIDEETKKKRKGVQTDAVKLKAARKGGLIKVKRGDGIAKKGKTKCRMR